MNTSALAAFLLSLSVCTLLYCIVPLILKYKNGAYCFKDSLQIAFINCIIATMVLYAFLLYMNRFNVNIIPLGYFLVNICILNIGYNKYNNVANKDFGFCTKCGADLDYNKRCTNCGAQYVNTNHLLYIFLTCSILAIIVFFGIYIYSKLNNNITLETTNNSQPHKSLRDAIEDGTYYNYFTDNQ